VVVLLLLLAGAAAAWWFLLGPGSRIPTPSVVGLTEEAATAILTDAGLLVGVENTNDDVIPAGEVISTDPAGGATVPRGGNVTIVVSDGVVMREVPILVGLPAEEATTALTEAGFVAPTTAEQYDPVVPAGVVISATANPGDTLPHNSQVGLVVSLGREPVEAPDVTARSLDEARAALEGAGLVVGTAEAYSDTVPEGAVVSQEPAPGQLLRGDTVTVTVSLGRPFAEVPSVFGMGKEAATEKLESAGFLVKVESLWGGSLGVVRFQDPAGGQQARLGSTVTITVV